MKDEIAQAIANELRLIREELQKAHWRDKIQRQPVWKLLCRQLQKIVSGAHPVSARVWATGRTETPAEPTRGRTATPVASSKRYEMREALMKLLASRKVASAGVNP
jgi:hypothetical protein